MARESNASCIIASLGPAQVGPFFFARSPAPILSSELENVRELENLQPLGPLAARPPRDANEATGGRIYRRKRDTDQTPTPAHIAPKNALT